MTRKRDAPSKPLSIIDNTVNSMDPLFHVLHARDAHPKSKSSSPRPAPRNAESKTCKKRRGEKWRGYIGVVVETRKPRLRSDEMRHSAELESRCRCYGFRWFGAWWWHLQFSLECPLRSDIESTHIKSLPVSH